MDNSLRRGIKSGPEQRSRGFSSTGDIVGQSAGLERRRNEERTPLLPSSRTDTTSERQIGAGDALPDGGYVAFFMDALRINLFCSCPRRTTIPAPLDLPDTTEPDGSSSQGVFSRKSTSATNTRRIAEQTSSSGERSSNVVETPHDVKAPKIAEPVEKARLNLKKSGEDLGLLFDEVDAYRYTPSCRKAMRRNRAIDQEIGGRLEESNELLQQAINELKEKKAV